MAGALDNPIFTDADKAREHLEAQRWPNGAICPHCGNADPFPHRSIEGQSPSRRTLSVRRMPRAVHRDGRHRFRALQIPLNKWLLAVHLMTSSKKGISAHQIHRMLGVTYKTAWFMAHRIREAMRDENPEPMGGEGQIIEADETYFGDKETVTKRTKRGKSGLASKRAVVALVERGGSVRSFHVDRADVASVREIVVTNVRRSSSLHTDESKLYTKTGTEFAAHETVKHTANEYVRGVVHTNTVEGFFSVFKRGMKGVYQHCAEKHLFRYLAEFDFRYNNRTKLGVSDVERRDNALKGIDGKRLTYRRVGGAAFA